ncbi:MAG: hypothetical protein AB7G37_15250, partial [Solirubrobacteraceae bacterium]
MLKRTPRSLPASEPALDGAARPGPRRRAVRALGLAGLVTLLAAAPAQADREFESRYSATVRGDVATAANQLVTCVPDVPPSTVCQAQQSSGALYANPPPGVYVDVDSDDDTINSSSATLTVPAGSTVRHASLYWGGRVQNTT